MTSDLPPMPSWLDVPTGARAMALALEFQFEQTQVAPPELFRSLQLEALRRLLAHAARHVPWYRERLGPDFRLASWQHWEALPVLERRDLQSAGEALVSESVPQDQGWVTEVRSSGSTGTPVRVKVTEKGRVFWLGCGHRDHVWHRRDVRGTLATIKHAGVDEALLPGKSGNNWGGHTSLITGTGPSHMLNSREPVTEQFRWLQSVRPDYLLTYPSLVLELARLNDNAGRPLRLRGISTLGEMLLPHQRAAGESSFGCRLTDIYSAQEIGYMALQCPRHDHYHAVGESCYLEILDENNRPCPPGVAGRVVVTPLHNYAQPLVRYAIGDHAIGGESCDCGIRLPVIRQLLGRTRNLVVLPNGDKAWPAYQPNKLMNLWPMAQFQLAQTSRSDLELRLANVPEVTAEQQQQAIALISQALPGFRITVKQVASLPRSAGGKYEEFICELPPS